MADLDMQVPCPSCGRKLKVKLRELSSGHSTRCPSCGCSIQFEGDGGRQAQRAIDDLNEQIKRLNRKLNIKFGR